MKEMDQYPILVKPTPSSPVSKLPLNSSQSDNLQVTPTNSSQSDNLHNLPTFLLNHPSNGIYWVLLKPPIGNQVKHLLILLSILLLSSPQSL